MKPWYWVSIDKKTGKPFDNQKNNVCPERLFATNVGSPVNGEVKLVSFTRDLSGVKRQKLEIITGPIDHDDNDSLDRIMQVLRAFTEAAATCTDSNGQCRIGITALAQHMTANPLMAHAAADGGPITFVVDPKVGTFNNMLQECVLVWNKGYDLSETNTQTNIGLQLSALATDTFGTLFSGVSDEGSGWRVSQRAFIQALDLLDGDPDTQPVPGMVQALASAPARGLFALLAYLMNAETYSEHYKTQRSRWRGWEGKNVQDVYLKTDPVELIAYVRKSDPQAAALFDKLPHATESEKNALATRLCVAGKASGATDLDCRPELDAMIALLAEPTDEHYRAFLADIPKPIRMFDRYGKDAFVVEARRKLSPLNQAGTFERKSDGSVDLVDRAAVRAKLVSFAWH